MKKWFQNLETWQIILGVVVSLGTILAGAYSLECHWNDSPEVEDVMLLASSNRKMVIEQELQRICEKYKMNWPCSTGPMNDQDKGRYEMYQKWQEEERKRLDRQMGGK